MLSVLKQYNEFLSAIRKDRSGTCPPDRFNIFYNEALLQWKDEQAKFLNLGQRRIDDMSYLKVGLDGIENNMLYTEKQLGDDANTELVKKVDDYTYTFKKPDGVNVKDHNGNVHPRYWRLGDVYFSIKDNNMDGYSTNSQLWIPGSVKVEGVKGHDLKSRYNGSNHYSVPVEVGRGVFIFRVNKPILAVKLTYLQMPQLLFFDKSKFDDVELSANPNFENGKGSVNTNLSDDAKREIVRMAAKMFLENSASQRYQTFSHEDYLQKLSSQ